MPVPPLAGDEEQAIADPRQSDVDEWGRSEHMRELARRLYGPIYEKWFRVEWEGLENIPTEGGALLVANHAGAIPSDAPVIMHGIETELGRPGVRPGRRTSSRALPVVGTLWARNGGVVAHPDNAYRLLREQGQLALVFPEGTKGPGKTYDERYRLRRFGRGGFVEIAMRAGVPIIPIAVVGAEESMPILAKVPALAKALGVPYVPDHRQHARCSARSACSATSRPSSSCGCSSRSPSTCRPTRSRYSRSRIMDEAEAIRQSIQEALYDMLQQRRSVWFG